MHRAATLSTLAALVLTGCATYPQEGEEAAAYLLPETTTRLVLHEPITIPGGSASVLIQDGELVERRDRYRPWCRLRLRTTADEPRTIESDTFLVETVRRRDELVQDGSGATPFLASVGAVPVALSGGPDTEGMQTARLGIGFGIGFSVSGLDDSGGPAWQIRETELRLHSDRQPEVYFLRCSRWDRIEYSRHLTIAEVRRTLGRLITIEPPADWGSEG